MQPPEKSTLARWFETPRGAYVLDWVLGQFDSAVEDVFGFNALQVGLPEIDFLRANRMPRRMRAGPEAGCEVRADPRQLPFATQSLDLVLLPHVLEFSDQPHAILREAERVLMPEGQIVIGGFNPVSLWGLKRAVSRRPAQHPWCGDFIGLLRLRDWLKLLGFELNGGRLGCYAPPFAQAKWLQRFAFMEKAGDRWWPIAGGVYVVRAKKRTQAMRIVTPGWRNGSARVRALSPVARREPAREVAARRAPPMLRLIRGGALPMAPAPLDGDGHDG
ncbi:MAG: class I SAM-dependent methyltransferase [Burkholderiales bacterium]|nr:class I SAM-dependent methyltransferase [Burkholderiales bacterium]